VKSCTYAETAPADTACRVTLYSGRKFYEPPEDAYRLPHTFAVEAASDDYVRVALTAPEGPLGTRDYRLVVEALALDESRTFLHVSYGYGFGWLGRTAMQTYLATLGQGKVGFTVVGRTKQGEPIYVDGVRGVVERNAVRYYLALQAYLEAADGGNVDVLRAAKRWFDLTERFARQLYELERAEYLDAKRKELSHQQRLQAAVEQVGACALPLPPAS